MKNTPLWNIMQNTKQAEGGKKRRKGKNKAASFETVQIIFATGEN